MKNKKIIYLIIIVAILALAFYTYGIKGNSTSYSEIDMEESLLDYLEEKYPDNEFKIDKFLETVQGKTDGVSCDGSVFIESKPIEGKYYTYYTVESEDPDLIFTAVVNDVKGKITFTDSFEYCKEIYEKIPKKLEKETDSEIEKMEFENGEFNIYMDSDLDDVLDEDYIETLKECSKFWKETSQKYKPSLVYENENGTIMYGRSSISVYLRYKDNKTVTFSYSVKNICYKDENESNPTWRNFDE